ncbi:Protein COFACTOR ASSEMBLY OF COMPLEX C SUBUNIT B CCB3, chloroplastic [Gracilariopsis chorda]|uniref:Protein COFACTOR ASSEMBLY OF COMPLEX C SUBUNIT B CCB3, chloroplastic n=1 Tax=Gracilariopsis chorda TaxID=448386 RepID=A0A2V3IRF6_9FLOR|nr:Protein COFACTOR ASSEMBLY OF COMPLEX C SUBUNIT B CCB3, chloroplastic [Gracilariopsis chorda]|eukprot:PXF44706.1 Protein COFACTOR ASSEMBLY OF COMPLEX C SUBUNIT B CCB3, chloroplastic [Gracilariopsis chorda]
MMLDVNEVTNSLPATHSMLPVVTLALRSPLIDAGKFIAGPCINLFNFVMIVRTILTWYPQTDLAKKPWIFIAVPTEPLLRATRKVIPPVGGVDITPIFWFAVMSFVHEILVGPQGLLVLLSQK